MHPVFHVLQVRFPRKQTLEIRFAIPRKLPGECSQGQYLEGAWKKQDRAQGEVELLCSCNKGFSQSCKELFRIVPVGPKGLDLSMLLYPLHQPVNG